MALPLLGARGGAPLAGDLRFGDVDEPHDVAVRGRVGAEEGAGAEDEVPGLWSEGLGQGGAAGDPAEVGEPDVAAARRPRVDDRPDARADAVGPDDEIGREPHTVREGHGRAVAVALHRGDLGPAADLDAATRGLVEQPRREERPLRGERHQAVGQRDPETELPQQPAGRAVHRVRPAREAGLPGDGERVEQVQGVEPVRRDGEVRALAWCRLRLRRSITTASTPTRCSAMAAAGPATPPPTMSAFILLPSLLRNSDS